MKTSKSIQTKIANGIYRMLTVCVTIIFLAGCQKDDSMSAFSGTTSNDAVKASTQSSAIARTTNPADKYQTIFYKSCFSLLTDPVTSMEINYLAADKLHTYGYYPNEVVVSAVQQAVDDVMLKNGTIDQTSLNTRSAEIIREWSTGNTAAGCSQLLASIANNFINNKPTLDKIHLVASGQDVWDADVAFSVCMGAINEAGTGASMNKLLFFAKRILTNMAGF